MVKYDHMNLGNKPLELKIERTVQLLCEYMPAGQDRKKPILMHAFRVGMYLYEHNYSEEVVLAGLLHDTLEWTDFPKDLILKEFGQKVLDITIANTQDRSLEGKTEQWKDMVIRCAKLGKEALIVKTVDTLDSYDFYRSVDNPSEIERSIDIGKFILQNIPSGINDPIFERLKDL